MSHSKKSFRSPGSKDLGKYLTELREGRTRFTQAQAARQLGLSRQQLHHYESGRTTPPDPLLIKIAQLYHVHPDEVLRKAYWPQLVLLPLVAIIEPTQLSEHLIEELEMGLEDTERQQLTHYIEELLRKRSTAERITPALISSDQQMR